MLFLSALLLSGALAAAPDTSGRPPRPHVLKLGLRAARPGDVALSYERQLAGRWSATGSLGYFGYTQRGGSIYHDLNGIFIEDYYTMRERLYSADAQLRYYFRRRTPRPLTGWFVAANLHSYLRTARQRHTRYTYQDYDLARWTAQLQLLLGRQWALGRRLTLDTYASVNLRRRPAANVRAPQVADSPLG